MPSPNLLLDAQRLNAPFLVDGNYRPQPLLAMAWRWFRVRHAQARGRRAAAGELRSMGERELQDLGIGRCQIGHFLQGP